MLELATPFLMCCFTWELNFNELDKSTLLILKSLKFLDLQKGIEETVISIKKNNIQRFLFSHF